MHERLAELRETAGRHHRPPPRRADRHARCECSSTSRASPAARREAPEIDGIIEVPAHLAVGQFHDGADRRRDGTRPRGRIDLMPVDPTAVKTWANLVTVARVLLAPFMFVLIPDEPGGSWVAFALVVRAVRQRRHRRLPGPPPRGHDRRRVPRPAGRQGAGARRDVHPRQQRHVLDRAGRHHRRPRAGDQPLPHLRRGQGRQRAGQQDRQVEDAHPAARGRLRHRAARPRSTPSGCGTACCGSRWRWH